MSVLFPDVPQLPGVPQLARLAGVSTASVISIGGAVLGSLFGNTLTSAQSGWGIYDSNNNLVVVADSILEFEHHPHWRISDFPVQGSGTVPTSFASYNKVKLPYEARVRLCKAGTLADRQLLLSALDNAANNTALYSIVTPERTYKNADIQSYDLVRSTDGDRAPDAYFLTQVDINFIEVISVQAQYSTTALQNAQNPSAQPQNALGTVQLQPISGPSSNLITNATLSNAFGAF